MSVKQVRSNFEKRSWMKRCISRVQIEREGGEVPEPGGSEPEAPSSEEVRLVQLEVARSGPMEQYLPAGLIDKMLAMDSQWSEALEKESLAHGIRREAVQNRVTAMKELARETSHGLVVFEYLSQKKAFSPALRDVLGFRNERPRTSVSRDWLLVAADFLKGHALMVSAGYPPITEPSAEELAAKLAEAELACKKSDEADLRFQALQAELRELSTEVGHIYMDVAAYLRYSLRRKPAPARRNIMRHFGYTFSSSSSEQQEPVPEETPTPREAAAEEAEDKEVSKDTRM